jgi:hypothetical protein
MNVIGFASIRSHMKQPWSNCTLPGDSSATCHPCASTSIESGSIHDICLNTVFTITTFAGPWCNSTQHFA